MKLLTLLLLGLSLAVIAPPAPAHADDIETRAARRHFDKADKLFALGRFDEALEQYQKAFDAKPIPDLLFNIGQCYRNLGDYDAAIFSFRKFLTLDPRPKKRKPRCSRATASWPRPSQPRAGPSPRAGGSGPVSPRSPPPEVVPCTC